MWLTFHDPTGVTFTGMNTGCQKHVWTVLCVQHTNTAELLQFTSFQYGRHPRGTGSGFWPFYSLSDPILDPHTKIAQIPQYTTGICSRNKIQNSGNCQLILLPFRYFNHKVASCLQESLVNTKFDRIRRPWLHYYNLTVISVAGLSVKTTHWQSQMSFVNVFNIKSYYVNWWWRQQSMIETLTSHYTKINSDKDSKQSTADCTAARPLIPDMPLAMTSET